MTLNYLNDGNCIRSIQIIICDFSRYLDENGGYGFVSGGICNPGGKLPLCGWGVEFPGYKFPTHWKLLIFVKSLRNLSFFPQ